MTIGAIILAMGVVWAFTGGDQDRSGASTLPLEVGECVTAAQYDDPSLVHEPVPCGTPEALYSLAYRGGAGDTCPDGAVGNESAYMAIRGTSVLYCFVLDVTEGECLNVQASKVRPVACTDVFANLRIGQILNDKTEPASCPDGNGFSWPQPARTVCFAPL